MSRSIDGPECAHGVSLFNPNGCPQCRGKIKEAKMTQTPGDAPSHVIMRDALTRIAAKPCPVNTHRARDELGNAIDIAQGALEWADKVARDEARAAKAESPAKALAAALEMHTASMDRLSDQLGCAIEEVRAVQTYGIKVNR